MCCELHFPPKELEYLLFCFPLSLFPHISDCLPRWKGWKSQGEFMWIFHFEHYIFVEVKTYFCFWRFHMGIASFLPSSISFLFCQPLSAISSASASLWCYSCHNIDAQVTQHSELLKMTEQACGTYFLYTFIYIYIYIKNMCVCVCSASVSGGSVLIFPFKPSICVFTVIDILSFAVVIRIEVVRSFYFIAQ